MKPINTIKLLVPKDDFWINEDYDSLTTAYSDTDSCYIDFSLFSDKIDERGIDWFTELADGIASEVNDSFPEFMQSVFLCPEDLSKRIESDREVISDGAVFFNKKRYAMKVKNLEGVACDKIKVMGLEIKKSDTPKVVQDFLKTIIKMLLDNTKYQEVNNYVESFKKSYYEMSVTEIGIPMNLKNLVKYENIYNQTGSTKRFPRHATGAIAYNRMCGVDDAKIRSGDKVKVIYTKMFDYKTLSIPADQSNLPTFVKDTIIDYDLMWSKIYDKVQMYLKPIGYDKESRQTNFVKSFLEF